MPNLFIIYVLFIGLFYNKIAGVTYGIASGILLDLFIGRKVGITAFMLATVGLIGGIFDKNFSKESRITINNDAWLGAGVIVLQGVTIGEYAIVGAGAVVTKDIPPYSIAVGNPARVIKTINKSQL